MSKLKLNLMVILSVMFSFVIFAQVDTTDQNNNDFDNSDTLIETERDQNYQDTTNVDGMRDTTDAEADTWQGTQDAEVDEQTDVETDTWNNTETDTQIDTEIRNETDTTQIDTEIREIETGTKTDTETETWIENQDTETDSWQGADTLNNDTWRDAQDGEADTWQKEGTFNDQDVIHNENSELWLEDMNTRFELRADQRTRLNDVMLEYQRERALIGSDIPNREQQVNDLRTRYDERLNEVFDDTQKENWEMYREVWWNDVNSKIDNADQFQDTDSRDTEDIQDRTKENDGN